MTSGSGGRKESIKGALEKPRAPESRTRGYQRAEDVETKRASDESHRKLRRYRVPGSQLMQEDDVRNKEDRRRHEGRPHGAP